MHQNNSRTKNKLSSDTNMNFPSYLH